MRPRAVICGVILSGALAGSAGADEPTLIARPDAFQSLVNPNCSHCVDEARRRAADLRDDDRVLAWIRGKYDGGGIPYRFFLAPYRVISDTYGVFVYDPEAGFARGFEPSLDFTFYGWRNGVLVIQRADGTLYSALSGRAFAGPRAGEQLTPVATLVTDWGHWSAAYPGSVAYHMFEKYQPLELPTDAHADSLASRGPVDTRLAADEVVLGVETGGRSRAWPISALANGGGLIHDRLDQRDLVVLWAASTRTAVAYASETEEDPPRRVHLGAKAEQDGNRFFDDETGSEWGIEGRAIAGPLKGQVLRWLPGVQCHWFAWAAEYPETELYAPPAGGKSDEEEAAVEPREALLVDPSAVTFDHALAWAKEGFDTLCIEMDETHPPEVCEQAAAAAAAAGLELAAWLEVGRNPALADEHPRWMASLGGHDDWRRDFPDLRKVMPGEVAKAWPWVPIGYRQAYEAHLERMERLIARAPPACRFLLLNDLQGGPSSCGCGNLQCRWALDYGVAGTAEKLDGSDVAARFVADVQRLAPERVVIPIWTTECERIDLAADGSSGRASTCLCGSVPCATGLCPLEFTKQWSALADGHPGPLGVLLTHRQFRRDIPLYGDSGGWIAAGLEYLDTTPVAHGGLRVPRERLWLVIEGDADAPQREAAWRDLARRGGAAAIVVSRIPIDAGYEPRIVPLDAAE